MPTTTTRRGTNVVVTMEWTLDDRGDDRYDAHVFVADDDGEPIGTVYGPMAAGPAEKLGARIASDRRLELNVERY